MELDDQTLPPGGYRNRPVSWVRRGVRMTEGQQIALDTHGEKYLIEPPRGLARESIAPGWQLDLASVFANSAPIILEIGTGRGENIVAAAERASDKNLIGVEVYGPGIARTILHAELSGGFDNLKMIQADAPEVLAALPNNSIAEIWIFFPDPWPKTKHLKRRMIDNEFANELHRVLIPGGILRLATDWEHYAVQMQEVFGQSTLFNDVSEYQLSLPAGPSGVEFEATAAKPKRFDGRVLTAFENKAHRAGRQITDLTYQTTAP